LSYVTSLRCRECSRDYPVEPINACEYCFGPLEVAYDYDSMARAVTKKSIAAGPNTMWRYHDFLPVEAENAVDLGAGFTPLMKADNLGQRLGLDNLYIKNDSVNPTFSFKDRPVSITTTKALEFEFEVLACVSTGNLMGAVAAHGAKSGMKTVVFFPSNLESGKIVGASIYGPTMVAVDGSYDQVNRLCSELADDLRWAFVNINMRPYYAEGSKTLGYEVAEQLGWRAPDNCVVPAASGELHTKIWKGLTELADIGLIDKARTDMHVAGTRMHLAQPEGCSPIVQAWEKGSRVVQPVKADTIAKSLAIGDPAAGPYAVQTLQETGGTAVAAPEEEIVEGIKLLAETEGIFTETAGGVVISGLRKLAESGAIKRDEVTVAFITGNGLKTQEVLSDIANPVNIKPTYASFEENMAAHLKS
jgi:threonine synthase